jgi:ribosome-binding ATPase YchF (GTP1/OBG family)
MDRSYDEVIADMLIQLDNIERRMEKADKRMELTIKRMVKAESRMELFDKKLEQSIKDQREFSQMQSQMNKYFLKIIKESGKK